MVKLYPVAKVQEFGSATQASSTGTLPRVASGHRSHRPAAKGATVPRKVVTVKGMEIGVYRFDGKFYAYENVCAHQGGPVCEGMTVGHTEYAVTDPSKRLAIRSYLSEKRVNLSCPWHGVEYDIRTGICHADGKMRLRSFKVSVKGDDVLVAV